MSHYALLTRYVGRLSEPRMDELNRALLIALDLDEVVADL